MNRREWALAYHAAIVAFVLVWLCLSPLFADHSWRFLGSCLGIMEVWFLLTLLVVPGRRSDGPRQGR